LLVAQGPHETQLAEHLHVLFVVWCRLADRLLAARRDVELIAEREALAEFELDAAARISGLEADHVPLHRAALGRAAADDPADAVLGHEVKGAVRAALDRLPAFHGQRLGCEPPRYSLKRSAAIW